MVDLSVAQLRNTAMLPLLPLDVPFDRISTSAVLASNRSNMRVGRSYDRVLWINDVLWCAQDMVRLLRHDADVACGLDLEDEGLGPAFYDIWVAKDVDGSMLLKKPPYSLDPASSARASQGLPFPVLACWNGAVAMPAAPFAKGLLFSAGAGRGDCRSSECERVVTDIVAMGYSRVLIDPSVRWVSFWLRFQGCHQWLLPTFF